MPCDSNTYTSEINSRKKEQRRVREKAQGSVCVSTTQHEDLNSIPSTHVTRRVAAQACAAVLGGGRAVAAGPLELTGQSV